MDAYTDVIRVFSDGLGQMLIYGNAARFKSFGGNLLLLVTGKMGNKRKHIYGSLFSTHIVDPDLRLRYTSTVPGLDVWLILLIAVASKRTATHDYMFFSKTL
mmetsp:Transcript_6504/g.13640  ORF Transcript_6504/g.13640 Transcript_6504/m.13640 type:complete len:102 (-) Transcript_6504:95-400(-)